MMPIHMSGDAGSNATIEEIRDFLVQTGEWRRPRAHLTDDLPLLNDVLDSLAVANLVSFIESDLGIEIGDDELEPSNFSTLTRIAAFIDAHR
jgi:acyl carrier protein